MVDRVYQRNTSDSAPQPPTDPSVGYPTGGNPAQGVPVTIPGPYWYHMITESLRRVIVEAGLTPDHENLGQVVEALQGMGLGTGQFQNYSSLRTYETGEVARGSDGHFYEFYDRDQEGAVQGVDPTDPLNRPHIWMRWDGNRPGQTIEWRSETLPEGYVENDGAEVSRTDYRRVFAVHGITYGAGDGATTFLLPDDRGEFKRGWDNERGVDPGRTLSDHQLDAMQGHWHELWGENGSFNAGSVKSGPGSQTAGLELGGAAVRDPISNGRDGTPRTATETRARNNAVNWITKI